MRAAPEPVRALTAERWVAVGCAQAEDRAQAAERATAAALAGAAAPRLLVAFVTGTDDLAAVGRSIASVAPGLPVVGCATPDVLPGGPPRPGEVVIAALGGDGLSVSTTTVAAASLRDAGAEAAACLGDVADRPHQALLLFVDPEGRDPQDVVRGAYSVAGAGVPLVGGGAAGDAPGIAALLHGTEACAGGVVAAAIGSDAPLGVGVRHGLRPGGEPLLVTRAEGSRVLELDGRPALDVYRERLPGGLDDRDAFLAAACKRPLGLSRRAGEEQVRTVVDVDFDERSLTFLGELPQGGLAWTMTGDAASSAAAAEAACADALAALGGARPRGLLAFQSVIRGGGCHGGPLGRHAMGEPVARGNTAGQIARTHGLVGFHNQAVAVLAVG
jgi:hypothetical protein